MIAETQRETMTMKAAATLGIFKVLAAGVLVFGPKRLDLPASPQVFPETIFASVENTFLTGGPGSTATNSVAGPFRATATENFLIVRKQSAEGKEIVHLTPRERIVTASGIRRLKHLAAK